MYSRHDMGYRRTRAEDFPPLNDLLHKMSTGKILTPYEKQRVQKHAALQRKKNLAKRGRA